VRDGCDAVVTAMDNIFAWNRRPGPRDFCILAQIEKTTPLQLYGRPGLRQLTDLRGTKLLVDAPGNGFVIALLAMLRTAGLRSDEYRLIEAGGVKERLDALLAGEGDATLLGSPFDALAKAAGQVLIDSVQDRYPAFPGQGIIVSRSALPRFREQLGQWLTALNETCHRASVDPDAVKTGLAQVTGNDPSMMFGVLPATLKPSRPGFDLLIAMRRELGLPGSEDSYDELVDAVLLP